MSIGELAFSNSGLGSETDFSMDFESEDCFLQILGKEIGELPEEHFIRPLLSEGISKIGEIHFLPNGNTCENPSNRTEILYLGMNAIKEYIDQLKTNNSIEYDFIYGRSDPQMASVAKRLGFTTIDNNSGSVIMYASSKDIVRNFEKLKDEGVLDKIKKRYQNLQVQSKE